MKEGSIILFDIDDTILKCDSNDICVIKIKNGKEERLSTDKFAKDPDLKDNNIKWSFKEFENPDKVRRSILNGTPLLKNLKIIENYIDKGYDCAFLTARGCEDVLKEIMGSFLFEHIPQIGDKFKKGLSYAISDEKYCEILDGLKHPQRKAKIIITIADMYNEVIFIDDDSKNINSIKQLHLPNVTVIKAK
jgi:hypothetical protein